MSRYNPDIHHRRSVRLRDYDYSQEGLYFITICVQSCECLFGNIANSVMPNHIHGIVEITPKNDDLADVGVQNFEPLHHHHHHAFQHIIPRSIGTIIRGFKIGVTKNIGYPVFQRNYYEHIISDVSGYARISEYIQNNPARWLDDKFHTE